MGSEEDREEFRRRFIARMRDQAGFERFDDGGLVSDYAEEVWESYWDDAWQREDGPEDCADADISYWGEG